MKLISITKRIAAILPMVSFFLPLTQCSQSTDMHGKVQEPVSMSAYSAYEWPSIGSATALILFSWPAAFQLARLRSRNAGTKKRFTIAEACLSILTIAGISYLLFWGNSIRYGAHVAYGSIASYLSATVFEFKNRQ